jgi:hypothetical protein
LRRGRTGGETQRKIDDDGRSGMDVRCWATGMRRGKIGPEALLLHDGVGEGREDVTEG